MKEVTIGSQIWMTQNLNVSTFRNGDPITEAKTDEEWRIAGQKKEPAWCYPTNGTKYGKLYNWYAVVDSRGLAPLGWHLPSDSGWAKLIDYLGGELTAGLKMKSRSGWQKNGTDEVGFSALPGGHRTQNGSFFINNPNTCFWSSTEFNTNQAWGQTLKGYEDCIYRTYFFIEEGLFVRCLKD